MDPNAESKKKIIEELLKTRFYSVLNGCNSEFRKYKVYKFKDTDSDVLQLFERPPSSPTPSNDDDAHHSQDKKKPTCDYCGNQLANCNRKNNICCVCGVHFPNGLAEHDDEKILSEICCVCDAILNNKGEAKKRHLMNCKYRSK